MRLGAEVGRYPNLGIRSPDTNQGKLLSWREVFWDVRVPCLSIVHSARDQFWSLEASTELVRKATFLQQWMYHRYDTLPQIVPPCDDRDVER